MRRKEKTLDIVRQLAKQLLIHRVFHGRSQSEVANVIDVSFQQYQKYEKCENRIFAEQLIAICKHYGWDIDLISNGDPNATIEEWFDSKVPNARAGVFVNKNKLLNKIKKIDDNAYNNFFRIKNESTY